MRYSYLLIPAIAGFILMMACKKEKSQEDQAPPASACDYAPYTDGSTFDYENVDTSEDTLRYTLTVAGDSVINDTTFKKLSDGSTTTYSACNNGNYVQMASNITFEGFTAGDIKTTFLKDNVMVGASWSDTIPVTMSSVTLSAILRYTITAKDAVKSVYSQEFKSVIGVKLDAVVIVDGTPIPVATISTNYYAKGVGLIQADRATDTTRLKSYTIK